MPTALPLLSSDSHVVQLTSGTPMVSVEILNHSVPSMATFAKLVTQLIESSWINILPWSAAEPQAICAILEVRPNTPHHNSRAGRPVRIGWSGTVFI